MASEQISLFDFDAGSPAIPPQAEDDANIPEDASPTIQEAVAVDEAVLPAADEAVQVQGPVSFEFELPPFAADEQEEAIVAAPIQPKARRGRMKLSDMEKTADLVNVPPDEELFSKQYYSIGTVAAMFHVNISLIRFWENEFDVLKPRKNGKGDRLFRPEDVKNLKIIHHLLREKKYTIDGARAFLKQHKNAEENFEKVEQLKEVRAFLLQLKATL